MLRIFGKTVAIGFGILAVALPVHAASGQFAAKPQAYTAGVDVNGGGTVYFLNVSQNMTLCTGSYVPLSNDKRLRFYTTENGSHMRAVVLSAILAGKSVSITWDDAHRDENNVCYIRSVTIAG